MLKDYLKKQAFFAVFSALILCALLTLTGFQNLQGLSKPIWYAFTFINTLFVVLYFIANESLKAKSQKDFVRIFSVLFSVKVAAVLAWLLTAIFYFNLRSNAYLLSFFALYLSYTFVFALQLFSQTKKK